jgi:hypothetical protein
MTTNLPSGPWRYMPNEHDDWGCIRDSNNRTVANTCPPWLADGFQGEYEYGSPSRGAGPPQARALAELLIRAEREADPTPLTPEMMPATLKVNAGWFLDFDWHCKKCTVFIRYETGGDGCGWNAVELMTINTMGEFRTFCRLLKSEVNG